MSESTAPRGRYAVMYAIFLPVIIVPAVVMGILLARGDKANRYYNQGLIAASAGNFAAARESFEKAGALGHAESDCNLVLLYRSGILTDKDADAAILRFLTRAALNGSLKAEFELGTLAENVPDPDYDLAALHYRRAALGGNIDGLLAMGRLHEHGLGINKSVLLAREFYLKAVKNKSPEGCLALGLLYMSPAWGRIDSDNAAKYLKMAAKAGLPRAFTALGCLCEQTQEDNGTTQQQAGKYFRRAAELGDPEGTVNYADYLYRHGLNDEAVKYYRHAAEKLNFSPACHRLGMYYYQLPEPDYAQARRYFERSAGSGNAASWINLGIMAELGQGGKIDLEQAMKCYQTADHLGHVDAAKRIKNLKAEN